MLGWGQCTCRPGEISVCGCVCLCVCVCFPNTFHLTCVESISSRALLVFSAQSTCAARDSVFHWSGSPLEEPDLQDAYLCPRSIMAEPDYIDDDNPELIRPQKLVNPVKTSRNHQDLHRELLMNQKRGLAPQNKPELQKVMEKRKRDQVIKQKEEEAQKKKSDLEIELLKRQQKLEQLELEKQKLQEEQENAPEFVKVKGNLRRTGQEVAQAQES
uniref:Family with sequence similarity 107 member B n=1 Tax=Sus scrofa TaxID=9823 RepID=A0A8D0RTJ9_PIG